MAENPKVNETDDITHSWVYGLKKGDRVWMAQEECIAQTEQFTCEFYEQSGPSEFEGIEEIFVPYEMEVVNNWTLNNDDGETHIIALGFVEPRKYRQLKFICQCNTRDLVKFFKMANCSSQTTVPTHIFKTQAECHMFCSSYLTTHFTVERCNTIVKELQKMVKRVEWARTICINDTCACPF